MTSRSITTFTPISGVNVVNHHTDDGDRAIARLASAQCGVVRRAQLLALGLTPRAIDHRLSTARLIALHRGVYAVGHVALSDRGRITAGLLAAGPHALASHTTAAYLYELILTLPATIELTTTQRARRSRPDLTIHQTTRPLRTRLLHSIPVTEPLRTLADLGFPEQPIREALARRLVRPEDLPAGGPAPTRSRLERKMLALIRRARLPEPEVNYPLGPYLIDFAWPDHGIVVETDGWATHGTRAAFESDRARDADLVARGYVVLRFTWRQITREPASVAATLAAALSRAGAAPAPALARTARAGARPPSGRR